MSSIIYDMVFNGRGEQETEEPKDRETGERLFDRRWVLVRGDENFMWENHGA